MQLEQILNNESIQTQWERSGCVTRYMFSSQLICFVVDKSNVKLWDICFIVWDY